MKKVFYIIGGIIILVLIITTMGGGEKKEASRQQQEQAQLGEEQEELTWHNVISFSETSNSSSKKTQPFLIKGKRWRIKWSFQDSEEFGEETNGLFIVNIYRVGESTITDQFSHSGLSADDTTYIYEGRGEFYLEITSYNAKNWSIVVEDLY